MVSELRILVLDDELSWGVDKVPDRLRYGTGPPSFCFLLRSYIVVELLFRGCQSDVQCSCLDGAIQRAR